MGFQKSEPGDGAPRSLGRQTEVRDGGGGAAEKREVPHQETAENAAEEGEEEEEGGQQEGPPVHPSEGQEEEAKVPQRRGPPQVQDRDGINLSVSLANCAPLHISPSSPSLPLQGGTFHTPTGFHLNFDSFRIESRHGLRDSSFRCASDQTHAVPHSSSSPVSVVVAYLW